MSIRITQKVNEVTLTQRKLVVKQEQRAIANIRIDRVILKEREVLNTTNFYNKQEIDGLLDNKVSVPTQAEWDNFTLTLQG